MGKKSFIKTVLIFAPILHVALFVNAQKIDSLEKLLNKTVRDSTRSLLLNSLAIELVKSNPTLGMQKARTGLALAKQNNFAKGVFENAFSIGRFFQTLSLFDSSIFYLRIAKQVAEKRLDEERQAETFSFLGHSFMRKAILDSSRYYLDKGLVLAKKINNHTIEAGIYNNYGNVFLEESNYQKALDYFVLAAKQYEQTNDHQGQCIALSNIGNIEYRLANYDKALLYAKQSMELAKKNSFSSSIGYAHKLLGRIYKKMGKYDSAIREYERGQNLYQQLGDVRSEAEVLQNIGNVYFDKNQHTSALVYYQKSLSLSKKLSSKSITAYAYSAIGQTLNVLRKYREALLYLDSANTAAINLGNSYLLMDNYSAISSVYEQMGDYKKALNSQRRHAQLKDSITQSENRQLSEETVAKYELEKKESQIALLTKDQDLKSLALKNQRVIQVASIIAILMVGLIAFLLVNRYRSMNRVKRQLEMEAMRQRIARDLHDDIGSALSSINIISQIAIQESPTSNVAHYKQINEQSSRMLETISDIVWSINPSNDSLEKVLSKIREFAVEILEPKNIQFHFTSAPMPSIPLDSEQRKNIFLTAKEAINNAAKYSKGKQVKIQVEHHQGNLILTVEDNGDGFDPQQKKNGNGIQNMKDRAALLKGHLMIRSLPSHGTCIILQVPIP